MYILDLQSKISITIATGSARHRDKRGNCYRTSGNMSRLWVKNKGQVQPWNGSKAEIKRAMLEIAKRFSWWVSVNELCTVCKREAVFRHKALFLEQFEEGKTTKLKGSKHKRCSKNVAFITLLALLVIIYQAIVYFLTGKNLKDCPPQWFPCSSWIS